MRSVGQRMALGGVAIGLVSVLACSGESDRAMGAGGTVGVELQIAPGVTVNTVSWSIKNGTTYSQSGTVTAQFSNTISFQVGGIPTGSGYVLTLTATSVDGSLTCVGSATFSVAGGQTTAVSINLVCSPAAADAGSIVVSGSTTVCANINSISVFPLETAVNTNISLAASASAGSIAPTYAWTTTAGTFDNAASATPVFTCPAAPGLVTNQAVTVSGTVADATSGVATLQARLDSILAEKPSRLAPLVTGDDVMRVRGIGPGPEVGRIKQRLEELVIDGEIPPDREAALEYLAQNPGL